MGQAQVLSTPDPISVAFFDRVALFSDFNDLFELLD